MQKVLLTLLLASFCLLKASAVEDIDETRIQAIKRAPPLAQTDYKRSARDGQEFVEYGGKEYPLRLTIVWDKHRETQSDVLVLEGIELDNKEIKLINRMNVVFPHVDAWPTNIEDKQKVVLRRPFHCECNILEAIRSEDNPVLYKSAHFDSPDTGAPFDLLKVRYAVDGIDLVWWNPHDQKEEIKLKKITNLVRTQVELQQRKSSRIPWYTRGQGERWNAPTNPNEEKARFASLFPDLSSYFA